MRRTQAQPYYQPIGERNRFLPEGPRAMRRQSREGIAWVNIQCGPDSTYGSLFFYDPEESREEGERLVFDHRLDCPSRPGFLLPIEGGDRVLVGLEKALRVCDLAKSDWSPPLAPIPDGNPRTIINDAEVVPGGKAIVSGTPRAIRPTPPALQAGGEDGGWLVTRVLSLAPCETVGLVARPGGVARDRLTRATNTRQLNAHSQSGG